MAFYTNPGWSNLTPPPVSEQNLNDMSNALEKAAYIENGKLYDNNNNLVDIGNAKITLGSYVGTASDSASINIGPNQKIFIMLSDPYGNSGNSTFNSDNGVPYWTGFFIAQIAFSGTTTSVYIPGRSSGQRQTLKLDYSGSTMTMTIAEATMYNWSGKTYHYATIGV